MTRRQQERAALPEEDERPGAVPTVADEEVAAVPEERWISLRAARAREERLGGAEQEPHGEGGGGDAVLLVRVVVRVACDP